MNQNPLDQVGREFPLSLANPNPKAARLKDGPRYRVEFEVDAETFDMFMSCRELSGLVIECGAVVTGLNTPQAAADGVEGVGAQSGPAPAEPRTPGTNGHSLAYILHRDGYFRNPALWRALHAHGVYTLDEHRPWVESMPCLAVTVRTRESPASKQALTKLGVNVEPLLAGVMLEIACEGDVCLHHVNSAAAAVGGRDQPGNPRKPLHFYGVPLCSGHHQGWAHTQFATREDKEKLLEIAVTLTAWRVKAAIKTYLGVESLSGVTPEQFHAFETEIGMPLTKWKGD